MASAARIQEDRKGTIMGVLLQGFFKSLARRPTGKPVEVGVPSPGDGDAAAPWWWDHIAVQARQFGAAGFSAVWLPPVLKGGNGTRSIGYDVFDDYDLG